jgi:peptidoglycan/LPS O-acetylase OafA/YrhL
MGDPKHNNFDTLRLVAAASVVFSHSFLIADGTQDHEPLIWLTGNQSILGLVGVFVFFAISGFLVTQSFEETGDAWRFLAKRALRIFPGLFVAASLSAFVLAPLVTSLPLGFYLSRLEPYQYVVGNTLLDQTVHELPGVRFVDNQVGLEINGSLWTLRYEFVMYLMVLTLGVLRLLTVRVAFLLVAFGVVNLHFSMLDEIEKWGWFFQLFSNWGWLVGFFAAGMVLYKLRHTRIFDGRVALLALAGLVLSIPLRQFLVLFPLFGCYLALWLALTPRLPVIPAARFGDLSYGIYIYGWPVEQGVAWLLGGHAMWWQVFLVALPAAAALAFLSWHLIERPALRLKPRARRSMGPRRDAGVEVGAAASMASIGPT